MNILIKEGRVLDPASKTDKVIDVLIKDGFIAAVEENIDSLIPLLSAWLTLPEDGRDTDGEAFTNRKLLLHLFALYILQIILLKL